MIAASHQKEEVWGENMLLLDTCTLILFNFSVIHTRDTSEELWKGSGGDFDEK